jgi:hypothetical protein
MTTYVECVSNSAFEDQLSEGIEYFLVDIQNNSILVNNDKGEERWYGRDKFLLKL